MCRQVTQDTTEAVAFGLAAARILEKVILNGGDASSSGRLSALAAVKAAVADMRDPARAHATEHDADLASRMEALLTQEQLKRPNFDVVQEVGQSCDFPNNLLSGAHLIAQGVASFADASRQRILAGGDSCSASMFNGGVFGALATRQGIPTNWTAATRHFPEVLAHAEALLSARAA